jgi:plasmid stabilization system protein ParE
VLEKPLNDVLLEGAIEDLIEAEKYYAIEMGSAVLFERAVSRAIEDAKLFPEAASLTGIRDVRKRILKRFPYHLIYLVHNQELLIVALAHHKRDPFYWIDRLNPQ